MRIFEEADAAIGPVYDMADIDQDPHFAARQMIQHLEGTPMQGLIAHLSHTPGALRWQGRAQDADGESIRNNGWGTTSR
jgi:crotonobetainyl-CoA:carnitine CoA-transferase CaiB-like acyl-CoA transferase